MSNQCYIPRPKEFSFVQAVNASNIVVRIPQEYQSNPVAFVADILDVDIYSAEPEARVIINQRTGTIVYPFHGC